MNPIELVKLCLKNFDDVNDKYLINNNIGKVTRKLLQGK